MSIEERISDALADIRVELFRGNKDPRIIDEVAAEYGLKPSVLAARLAKAYGSLEDMNRWLEQSANMRAIEARMKAAIQAYAETEGGIHIAEWLEKRAGRAPTWEEVQFADGLWMQNVLNKIVGEPK